MDPHLSKPETNAKPTGKGVGPIPRGIEVLVTKAAVDPTFKQLLLEKRAAAAEEIGLKLEPAEVAMLTAVPAAQLETIVANTDVNEVTRAAFLGRAAAVMLAALGASTAGCSGGGGEGESPPSNGIRPDRVQTKGEQPDRPPNKDVPVKDQQSQPSARPDQVKPTEGIRPDRPAPKEPSQPGQESGQQQNLDELRKRIAALAEKLNSPDYATREEATGAIIELGKPALPLIEELKTDDQEIASRLERVRRVLKGDEMNRDDPDRRDVIINFGVAW
jgi:hypothetical protein